MASSEPVARYKHVSLHTQQKRLRHLRLIAVRNIVHSGDHTCGSDISQIETYFTLHRNEADQAFYTSEKIKGSLNPTWRSFQLEQSCFGASTDEISTASTNCVVRVWRGVEDNVRLYIEWTVHLDGLLYLGDKSQKEGHQYPQNTVLFGMLDGIYGAQSSSVSRDLRTDQIVVEQASTRESYDTHTLLRIKTILRAIKQTQSSVHRVKHTIGSTLHHSNILESKESQKERQLVINNLVRRDLDWRLRASRAEKETYENIKTENQTKEKRLNEQFLAIQSNRSVLHEKKKGYFDVREDLIKTGAQLVMRRKQLISELAFIYPIVEVPSNKYFTVCGVKLPNSEDFLGQDETMIAVALGATCHLVDMISNFLDVPLRYPMEHEGSRSNIRDHIIDKLQDRERDFPLYTKGKEKFQFNYGVYLLNKNISQLRYYCALGTTDLRLTLPNLKSLLEFRLGVKFESTNAPVLAGQHMAIPPNLGGPQKSTSPYFGLHRTGNTSSATISASSSQSGSRDISPESDVPVETVSANPGEAPIASRDPSQTRTPGGKRHGSQTLKSHSSHDLVCMSEDRQRLGLSRTTSEKDMGGLATPTHNSHTNVQSHSKDICISPSMSSPTIRTLDIISREKLMGAIANYDDIDVSSSEDSACATYASRFKMWPRDHLDVSQAELQWSGEEGERSTLSPDTQNRSGASPSAATPSTFKTKAMTSPVKSDVDSLTTDISSDDMLTVNSAESPMGLLNHVNKTSGLFSRQRTDSEADTEECATFVIPGNEQLHKPIHISDHS